MRLPSTSSSPLARSKRHQSGRSDAGVSIFTVAWRAAATALRDHEDRESRAKRLRAIAAITCSIIDAQARDAVLAAQLGARPVGERSSSNMSATHLHAPLAVALSRDQSYDSTEHFSRVSAPVTTTAVDLTGCRAPRAKLLRWKADISAHFNARVAPSQAWMWSRAKASSV